MICNKRFFSYKLYAYLILTPKVFVSYGYLRRLLIARSFIIESMDNHHYIKEIDFNSWIASKARPLTIKHAIALYHVGLAP